LHRELGGRRRVKKTTAPRRPGAPSAPRRRGARARSAELPPHAPSGRHARPARNPHALIGSVEGPSTAAVGGGARRRRLPQALARAHGWRGDAAAYAARLRRGRRSGGGHLLPPPPTVRSTSRRPSRDLQRGDAELALLDGAHDERAELVVRVHARAADVLRLPGGRLRLVADEV